MQNKIIRPALFVIIVMLGIIISSTIIIGCSGNSSGKLFDRYTYLEGDDVRGSWLPSFEFDGKGEYLLRHPQTYTYKRGSLKGKYVVSGKIITIYEADKEFIKFKINNKTIEIIFPEDMAGMVYAGHNKYR